MFHDPCFFLNKLAKLKSGGLVLLRRVTPLTRRDVVYFCSGVYTGSYDRAINDYDNAIGMKIREVSFLMSLGQIRAIYPELGDVSDQDLLEGLRQKYFPAMSSGDFSGQYQRNKQFDDFALAELYEKRGDAYLADGRFRKGSLEYARAVHASTHYDIDRWRRVFGGSRLEYHIDLQTLDFTSKGIASLWLKTQQPKVKTYTDTNFQIDCGAKRIKSVSSATYNSVGNATQLTRSQEWQSIIPDSFGELLYKGMCQ